MVTIYKLFSKNCDSFYIGSTTKTLKQRLGKHKDKSYEAPNRKVYKCILGNGGFKQWEIEALETFETDNAIERRTREQYYINELKPDLNSVLAINIG
jgi:hypothetical protein